jgi:hypothetical protein
MHASIRSTCFGSAALAALVLFAPRGSAQVCAGPVHDEPLVALGVFATGSALHAAGALGNGAWGIARFDGAQWTSLPGAFDGAISAVAQTSFGLIAAGSFGAIDGAPCGSIARFDGQQWHALGAGIDGGDAWVLSVHEHAGRVYAGGSFESAGGVSSPNIASWDGASWHEVLGGTDGIVRALASYADALVVGGDYDSAGGLALQNIASWDGASWSSLGSPALGPVWDLEVSGTRLYAASGALLQYVGGSWQTLGAQQPDLSVRSIALGSNGIYVHGPGLGFCLSFSNEPCLKRARFSAGEWADLGFDEYAPMFNALSLAAFEDAVYETGDTAGLRVYSAAPKLHAWGPAHGPWYGATQLALHLTCLDPLQPATVSVDGVPLATSIDGPNAVSAVVPAHAFATTGPLELRFEQGGEQIVVPGGFVSRPSLSVQTAALFAQNIKFRVHSGSGVGTAWILIAGQQPGQSLALPGIHASFELDLASGALLGSGALAPDSAFFATLGFVLPLGTVPPGFEFRAQAFVAEQTPSGVQLAFTNAVDVVAP